jgi:hypothetical protein
MNGRGAVSGVRLQTVRRLACGVRRAACRAAGGVRRTAEDCGKGDRLGEGGTTGKSGRERGLSELGMGWVTA